MNSQKHSEPVLKLVSAPEDSAIQVDIIKGLSGYEFSRLRLTASVGSVVVWTNQTALPQLVHLQDQIIRLAPGRKHGATVSTRLSALGEMVGRLGSNPEASITFSVKEPSHG
jgi:hypothetical protein